MKRLLQGEHRGKAPFCLRYTLERLHERYQNSMSRVVRGPPNQAALNPMTSWRVNSHTFRFTPVSPLKKSPKKTRFTVPTAVADERQRDIPQLFRVTENRP